MTLKVLDLFSDKKIWHDRKGYACVWVRGKTKKCHVLVWEYVMGMSKPLGYDIHHLNEDKSDFRYENLLLISKKDHFRLHAGWVSTDGEWTHKPCNRCKVLLPLDSFYVRKGYTPTALCKPCHLVKTKEWASKNPEARKSISLKHYYKKSNSTKVRKGG